MKQDAQGVGDGREEDGPQDDAQRRDIYSRLLNLWRLEEYLLHTYHSIFLTVNSVLFGIATLLTFRNTAQAQTPHSLVRAITVVGAVTCFAYLLLFLDRAHASKFPVEAMIELDRNPGSVDKYEKTYSAFAEYRKARIRTKIRSKPRFVLALLPVELFGFWVWLAVYAFS